MLCQIQQRKNPGFDGNDEHDQELGFGVHGGIAQEQAQVQVIHTGPAAEDHAVDVHHQDAAEVEQIELAGAPGVFHGPADGIVAEEEDDHHQGTAHRVGQRIGDQPPDLSLEDQRPVKNEILVEDRTFRKLGHEIDQCGADADVEHQIGDALVPVLEAEPLKAVMISFQWFQLP